ncbi:hypothetical protein RIF29_32568 [Crotalaria pallida]|uniref:Uncharacterized protein n=1 Tax=Crotalaria pallida TaxID=3830 RepID=A0AAN9I2I1_CROPI
MLCDASTYSGYMLEFVVVRLVVIRNGLAVTIKRELFGSFLPEEENYFYYCLLVFFLFCFFFSEGERKKEREKKRISDFSL